MGFPASVFHRFSVPFSPKRKSHAAFEEFLTPLNVAIEELESRNADPEIRRKVETYLGNDIPDHFRHGPILYLARHVATPNFETLRFLHLVEPFELPAVIGQDLEDKFVAHNQLKKALGKLPISLGIHQKEGVYHERYTKVNVIDFNQAHGKPFSSIKTHWGEDIHAFHIGLFDELCTVPFTIVNDSEWITRNHRGSLVEHYKRFLALFVTHGILFEDYSVNDAEEIRFLNTVLRPAFRHIERIFKCRPLIAQLTPTTVESPEYWISYPHSVASILKQKFAGTQPQNASM